MSQDFPPPEAGVELSLKKPNEAAAELFGIDQLLALCSSRFTQNQIDDIYQAYSLADKAHSGQSRRSGEDYIYHPIAVAKLVFELGMDPQSVISALLHDVLEDTPVKRQEIVDAFGEPIAHIVDGLSKLENIDLSDRRERQAANFRKMILAMVDDIRIIIIKLSDRVHNMRTIESMSQDSRERIARETLDVYAPIAHRLGIESIKNELEDLGFQALYPARHRVIGAQIKKAREKRSTITQKIEVQLNSYLSDQGIEAKIVSREKHLYSLYQKMKKKQLAFKDVYDMFGIRIMVDSIDSCYRVLGVVHQKYTPRLSMFKDYIAIPKENGYQSLHTVLLSSDGVTFEAQIRTHDMERYANSGVASHWAYKAGESPNNQVRVREWLANIMDLQATATDTLDFYENVKRDLSPSEVYVHSPTGEIFPLPAKATVVDFAYAVHSKIGQHCYGAQIDGRPSALSTQLQSGQRVQILTKEFAQPMPSWLDHVVTPKARNQIRHYLRNRGAQSTQAHGRAKLDAALRMARSKLDDISNEQFDQYLESDRFQSKDKLYLDIGLGLEPVQPVVRKLLSSSASTEETGSEDNQAPKIDDSIVVDGSTLAYVSPAKCCLPIPGDNICGYRLSSDQITLHRKECSSTRHMHKREDQWVWVSWGDVPNKTYTTDITVEMLNIPGSLNEVTDTLTRMKINIENIQFHNRGDRFAVLSLLIAVKNRDHLARIIRKLRNTPAVNRVKRRLES